MKHPSSINRREFLQFGSLGMGALVLAACGQADPATQAPAPTNIPAPTPASRAVTEPTIIVGDVLNFNLTSDEWPGRFGSVTFRLWEGFAHGGKAYFIRTDASNQDFAQENGLVFVPKLNVASREGADASAKLYLFQDGVDGQRPILSNTPTDEDYTSLFQVHFVSRTDTLYDSESSLLEAADAGNATVDAQNIFVNYPVVKWPDGEMSVDEEKDSYLGTGQLLTPVDTDNMTVTFKLHECFPSSRYIVTDTSAAPMAPMMSISPSPGIQGIQTEDFDGTDKIWVFANGIEGSGVMGFQPAIFAHTATDPVWSPMWDHFTLRWKEDTTPRILKSADDINAALEVDELELFNGTPDSHPTGFIVNCPVPVLAPNTFSG